MSGWLGNKRGRNQMILTGYRLDVESGDSKATYLVRHSSQVWKTTLEQNLTIERDSMGNFKPSIALDDFPRGLSDREAMLKLADWLHRLSVTIENNWSEP